MFKKFVLATLLLLPSTAIAQQYVAPAAPAAPTTHQGLTIEANLGFGSLRTSAGGDSTSDGAIGGLDLGIGGFINPRTAITLRVAGVTYVADGGQVTQAFVGPSLQYWASEAVWFGGGLGLGVGRVTFRDGDVVDENGLGLDARLGYTFNPGSKHSFNASIEYTSSFLDGGSLSGFSFLVGYQLL